MQEGGGKWGKVVHDVSMLYFYNQYLYLIKLITEYLENSAQIKGRVLLSALQNVIHLNRNYTNRFMQTY